MLLGIALMGLGGLACTTTSLSGDVESQRMSRLQEKKSSHFRITSVPVPGNFKFDRDNSFVYETGDRKITVGHLFYSGSGKLEDLVAFYQNEMINNQWVLVRTIEQEGTTMMFEKEGEVCDVFLKSSFASSTIEIQYGPR